MKLNDIKILPITNIFWQTNKSILPDRAESSEINHSHGSEKLLKTNKRLKL